MNYKSLKCPVKDNKLKDNQRCVIYTIYIQYDKGLCKKIIIKIKMIYIINFI